MAWSYRNDSCDEVYSTQAGPTVVDTSDSPTGHGPPRDAQHAKEILDPKEKDKRLKEEEKYNEAKKKEQEAAAKPEAAATNKKEPAHAHAR